MSLRRSHRARALLSCAAVVAAFSLPAQHPQFVEARRGHVGFNAYLPESAALADLDGDGDLDLACAGRRSREAVVGGASPGPSDGWFRNLGGGRFELASEFGTGLPNSMVRCADLDGDALPDVVLGPALRLLRNQGNGQFVDMTAVWLPAGSFLVRAIELADLDNDGDIDAALGDVTADTVVWNNGTGRLTGPGPLPGGRSSDSIVAVDIDADGDRDLVGGGLDGVAVYVQQPGGSFVEQSATRLAGLSHSMYTDVAAEDLDGDGAPDLVLGFGRVLPGGVEILTNAAGRGTFTVTAVLSAPLWDGDFELADADGDGDADLLASVVNLYYENQGAMRFAQTGVSPLPARLPYASMLAVGDIDADGDVDVFASTEELRLLVNVGSKLADGGEPQGPIPLTSEFDRPSIVDLDGDGRSDRIVHDELNDRLTAYLATGVASFRAVTVYQQTAGTYGAVAGRFADLDGDLDLDAVLIENARLTVLENLGAGALWAPAAPLPFGRTLRRIEILDFDSDRQLDLVVEDRAGSLVVLRNTGNLVYQDTTATALPVTTAPGPYSALTSGDVDGDGDVDLVFAVGGNRGFLRSLGNGSFADASQLLPFTNDGIFCMRLLDLDRDGDLDLLEARSIAAMAGTMAVVRNDTQLFVEVGAIAGARAASAWAADFDLDGFTDAVTPFDLLRNRGGTLVAEPLAAGVALIAVADGDDDGDTDLFYRASGELRMLANRHRQLTVPFVAERGGTLDLVLSARPGALPPGTQDFMVPYAAARSGRSALPPLGVLQLDPTTLVPFPVVVIPSPGGDATLSLRVPVLSSLRGVTLPFQALHIAPSAGPSTRFTNSWLVTIE